MPALSLTQCLRCYSSSDELVGNGSISIDQPGVAGSAVRALYFKDYNTGLSPPAGPCGAQALQGVAEGQKGAMRQATKKQVTLLNKLCDMGRGSLGKLDRKKVVAPRRYSPEASQSEFFSLVGNEEVYSRMVIPRV